MNASLTVLLLVVGCCLAAPQNNNLNYELPSGNVRYSRQQTSGPIQFTQRTVQYSQPEVHYTEPIVRYTQPAVQYSQELQPEARYTQIQYSQPQYFRPQTVRISKRPINRPAVLPAGQPIQPLSATPSTPVSTPSAIPVPLSAQSNYQRPLAPPVAILTYNSDLNYDGNFNYDFSAENGIASEARGSLKAVPGSELPGQVMQGSYTYIAPDGTPITTTWYADETGFHAEGAHLPTPPPIPEAIARSLDYIRSLPPTHENNKY